MKQKWKETEKRLLRYVPCPHKPCPENLGCGEDENRKVICFYRNAKKDLSKVRAEAIEESAEVVSSVQANYPSVDLDAFKELTAQAIRALK